MSDSRSATVIQFPQRAPAAAPSPAQPRKKHARKAGAKRGHSATPGVVLRPPAPPRRPSWRADIEDDPTDPRRSYSETIPGTVHTDKRAHIKALEWARKKSAKIIAARAEQSATGETQVQLSLPKALELYLQWYGRRRNKRGQLKSKTTLYNARRHCQAFVDHCVARGLLYCGQLQKSSLADWRETAAKREAINKGGATLGAGALNQERGNVRRFLRRLVRDGFIRSMSVDEVYGALELDPEAEPERLFLDPHQYVATLESVLQYDERARLPMAPSVLITARLGWRREEWALLRKRDVEFGGPRGAAVLLDETKAKFGKKRTVHTLPYSPLAERLLRALCANRSDDEYLCERTYPQLGEACKKLARYAAMPDDFHFHMLRRTSVSYARPLEPSDGERRDQWGHDEDTAAKHYEAASAYLPLKAASIDEVVAGWIDRQDDPDKTMSKLSARAVELELRIVELEERRAAKRKPRQSVRVRVAQRYVERKPRTMKKES
jgi:hypothetical protein